MATLGVVKIPGSWSSDARGFDRLYWRENPLVAIAPKCRRLLTFAFGLVHGSLWSVCASWRRFRGSGIVRASFSFNLEWSWVQNSDRRHAFH